MPSDAPGEAGALGPILISVSEVVFVLPVLLNHRTRWSAAETAVHKAKLEVEAVAALAAGMVGGAG